METMTATITTILAAFLAVLGAIVGAIGDIATFMVTNPLLLVGVGLTIGFAAFGFVRTFLRH